MLKDAKSKANAIHKSLCKTYPDAKCELNYNSPLQLLIATILSAQCTDVRVNKITEVLFSVFKNPNDYFQKSQAELEKIIQSAGFFRQKAKSIREAVKIIFTKHNGVVPDKLEDLVQLPGVGRKTANVVLGNAFNLPGLPVDTHVTRLANRFGLVEGKDAVKIEAILCNLLSTQYWCQFSHNLIFHGRRICKARNPLCDKCNLTKYCNYYKEEHE